ncbi:hypothetical protein REPUB_Repub10bG0097900 [Reevesia pubescens]
MIQINKLPSPNVEMDLSRKLASFPILCDIDIALIMFSPSGRVSHFFGKKSLCRIEYVLSRYINLTDQDKGSLVWNKEFLLITLKKLQAESDFAFQLASSSTTTNSNVEIYLDAQEAVPSSFENEVMGWLLDNGQNNPTQYCVESESSCIPVRNQSSISTIYDPMPHGTNMVIDACDMDRCHVSTSSNDALPPLHHNYTSSELLFAFMPSPTSFPLMKGRENLMYDDTLDKLLGICEVRFLREQLSMDEFDFEWHGINSLKCFAFWIFCFSFSQRIPVTWYKVEV